MKTGYKAWLDNNGKAFGGSPDEGVAEIHSLHGAAKELGISIFNDAFRNLHLSRGKMVRIVLRGKSRWVMT